MLYAFDVSIYLQAEADINELRSLISGSQDSQVEIRFTQSSSWLFSMNWLLSYVCCVVAEDAVFNLRTKVSGTT